MIIETKKQFFAKINKIDQPLSRITKKKIEMSQINKTRSERGEITTDTIEVSKTIREYYKQLYANKLDDTEEMDTFLEMYNLARWNQEGNRQQQLYLCLFGQTMNYSNNDLLNVGSYNSFRINIKNYTDRKTQTHRSR